MSLQEPLHWGLSGSLVHLLLLIVPEYKLLYLKQILLDQPTFCTYLGMHSATYWPNSVKFWRISGSNLRTVGLVSRAVESVPSHLTNWVTGVCFLTVFPSCLLMPEASSLVTVAMFLGISAIVLIYIGCVSLSQVLAFLPRKLFIHWLKFCQENCF